MQILLDTGPWVALLCRDDAHHAWAKAQFDNVPASLADACLLRMSELAEPCKVMTLDRDFQIYRRHGRKTIPVLSPWA